MLLAFNVINGATLAMNPDTAKIRWVFQVMDTHRFMPSSGMRMSQNLKKRGRCSIKVLRNVCKFLLFHESHSFIVNIKDSVIFVEEREPKDPLNSVPTKRIGGLFFYLEIIEEIFYFFHKILTIKTKIKSFVRIRTSWDSNINRWKVLAIESCTIANRLTI